MERNVPPVSQTLEIPNKTIFSAPTRHWPDEQTVDFIRFWSGELEQMSAEQILHWAADAFFPKLALVTTSFGLGGCVLTSMLPDVHKEMKVINIDTGYQFPETKETAQRLEEKYGVNIVRHRSGDSTYREVPLYRSDPSLCCHINKFAVLRGLAPHFDALVFGGRRGRPPSRKQILEWDEHLGLLRIYPLTRWTKRCLWEKISRESIPYNRLLDCGYSEIDCAPCTSPVFSDWDFTETA